jgi:hypothetical protein
MRRSAWRFSIELQKKLMFGRYHYTTILNKLLLINKEKRPLIYGRFPLNL